MKKVILVGLVVALMLSVVPAMATTNNMTHDNTPVGFQAMRHLSTVVPMTEAQLASVEGTALINLNLIIAPQINICVLSPGCTQINILNILQSIGRRR